MAEKHDKQFTVKLTESQHDALKIEADLRGMSEVDLVRSFIDDLQRKQIHAFRLLAEKYEGNETIENMEIKVSAVR